MTKKLWIILLIVFLCIFLNRVFTKPSTLDKLLAPLELHQGDLGIELISVTENEFLLKKVIGLIEAPLSLPAYSRLVSSDLKKGSASLEQEIKKAAAHLEIEGIPNIKGKPDRQLYAQLVKAIKQNFKHKRTSKQLLRLLRAIFSARRQLNHCFNQLSDEELELLYQHLSLGLLEDYKAPKGLSKWELQWFEEDLFLTAKKVKLQEIIAAAIAVAKAIDAYQNTPGIIFPRTSDNKSLDVKGDIILQLESSAGQIIIGGFGDNEYRLKNPALIIDPSGDDKYFFAQTPKKQVSIIIDHQAMMNISLKKTSLRPGQISESPS